MSNSNLILTVDEKYTSMKGVKTTKFDIKSEIVRQASIRNRAKESERTIMANMFKFDPNMKFGVSQDLNLASTMTAGIAIKSGKIWSVYNSETQKLTEWNGTVGQNLLLILPSISLKEGDLIRSDDEYYFVVETNEDGVKALSASTGKIKNVGSTKNLSGSACYSKVIVLD